MEQFVIKRNRPRGDRRSPYVVAEEIGVKHPEIHRDTGRRIGGLVPIVESTGRRDRKRLELEVLRGTTARGGEPSRSRDRVDTDASGAGVKRVCRRLRPQEAERLAAIDGEIAEIEADLRAARDRRESLVREAFAKGHVVRLAQMLRLAASGPGAAAAPGTGGEAPR